MRRGRRGGHGILGLPPDCPRCCQDAAPSHTVMRSMSVVPAARRELASRRHLLSTLSLSILLQTAGSGAAFESLQKPRAPAIGGGLEILPITLASSRRGQAVTLVREPILAANPTSPGEPSRQAEYIKYTCASSIASGQATSQVVRFHIVGVSSHNAPTCRAPIYSIRTVGIPRPPSSIIQRPWDDLKDTPLPLEIRYHP